MNSKKRYLIKVQRIIHQVVDVIASNEKEAIEKAENEAMNEIDALLIENRAFIDEYCSHESLKSIVLEVVEQQNNVVNIFDRIK